jgi:hypothetical protein
VLAPDGGNLIGSQRIGMGIIGMAEQEVKSVKLSLAPDGVVI